MNRFANQIAVSTRNGAKKARSIVGKGLAAVSAFGASTMAFAQSQGADAADAIELAKPELITVQNALIVLLVVLVVFAFIKRSMGK